MGTSGKSKRVKEIVIIEKEVLPFYVFMIIISLGISWALSLSIGLDFLKKLQTPILRPYAVHITKHDAPGLEECKDSWKQDEFVIKVLRAKIKRHELQGGSE